MSKPVYDTRKILETCEYESLNRQLGVWVTEKFLHRGWETDCQEVGMETVSVNSVTYSKVCKLDEVGAARLESTTKVIEDISAAIEHLQSQRRRLKRELKKLVP